VVSEIFISQPDTRAALLAKIVALEVVTLTLVSVAVAVPLELPEIVTVPVIGKGLAGVIGDRKSVV
jgi:hypothetical protein